MQRPEAVSSELYDEPYFLGQARGGPLFLETAGRLLPDKGYVILPLADFRSGQRVLDIGCGRGELTLQAALAGAEAYGVDYAAAAVRCASRIRDALPEVVRARLHFQRVDAKHLPFRDQSFDRIVTSEFTEHVHPWELEQCYRECARVLRPDGHMVVHTAPNRWRYTIYYPLRGWGARLLGREPAMPGQDPLEEPLHVNEHTPVYMWRSLRRQFLVRVFVRSPRRFFAQGLVDRLRRANPVELVRAKNLWALAVPPGADAGAHMRALRRRIGAAREELRMGAIELPHLRGRWSRPVWGPPVVRVPRAAAAVRMAGRAGARALEIEYRWLGSGAPMGEVELAAAGRGLGRATLKETAGTLRFEGPASALERAHFELQLRAPDGFGVHALRLA